MLGKIVLFYIKNYRINFGNIQRRYESFNQKRLGLWCKLIHENDPLKVVE